MAKTPNKPNTTNEMNNEYRDRFVALGKRFKLGGGNFADQAMMTIPGESNQEYLLRILSVLGEGRDLKVENELFRRSGMPAHMRMQLQGDYSFPDVQVCTEGWTLEKLYTCSWVTQSPCLNVLQIGETGTLKTTLQLLLGSFACHEHLSVLYIDTTALIEQMQRAQKADMLPEYKDTLRQKRILMLDNFGTSPISAEGAMLLLQYISTVLGTQSIVVATTREFSAWGSFIKDSDAATALAGRLASNCVLLAHGGPNHWLTTAQSTIAVPKKTKNAGSSRKKEEGNG